MPERPGPRPRLRRCSSGIPCATDPLASAPCFPPRVPLGPGQPYQRCVPTGRRAATVVSTPKQLASRVGRLVEERAQVAFGGAEVDDRGPHGGAALEQGGRQEEGARADQTVDDPPVEAGEVVLGQG